jgi:hypothetical protein
LIRLHFAGDDIEPSKTDFESHVARYIFNESETFSRISIVETAGLAALLDDFERLHKNNVQLFSAEVDGFFDGIMDQAVRLKLYEPDFLKDLKRAVRLVYMEQERRFGDIKLEGVVFNKAKSVLEIEVCQAPDEYDYYIMNEYAMDAAIKLAQRHFKYSGKVQFTEGIPF